MEVETDKQSSSLEEQILKNFNEEKWTRTSAKDISISRFTILDQLIEETTQNKKENEVRELAQEHLLEYNASASARYILGILDFENKTTYFNELIGQLEEFGKWSSIVALTNKIPTLNNNRSMLHAKLNALEKLSQAKQTIPVLERLVEIDKKNAELFLKLATAIQDEDKEKALFYYKRAAEGFARDRDFDSLKIVWSKLIELIPNDFSFYKKIERVLTGFRQRDLIADLYSQIAFKQMEMGEADNIIFVCKKILEHNPSMSRFQKEIMESLSNKHKDHSLFEEIVRISGLKDNKRPFLNAVSNFETYIVFDKENYVSHRSWGVGQIVELNTKEMVIDFKEKPAHKMDIKMALKSLKPLTPDHFWVYQYQEPETLQKMFEEDFDSFFEILIRSFGDKISLSEIKSELINHYVPTKDWSKWWTKTRSKILDSDNISVSPQRKDVLEYHETAISQKDQLIEKFQTQQSDFNDKVNVSLSALKKYKEKDKQEEILDVIFIMIPTFEEGLKGVDIGIQVLSLILLEMFAKELGEEYPQKIDKENREFIVKRFAELSNKDVIEIVQSPSQTELKREIAVFIQKNHPRWQKIYLELLFQLPIKIHNLLYTTLFENEAHEEIKEFYSKIRRERRKNPEVFLWSIKNNFVGNKFTNFESEVDYHLVSFFRFLKFIPKIELKGTKLKNNAREILIGSGKDRLRDLIAEYSKDSIRKFSVLVRETSIFIDLEKEQIMEWLQEIDPEVFVEDELEKTKVTTFNLLETLEKEGGTVASADAIENLRKELEHLINVEMPENSKEIGIAQEKGDLRENAEYKAAMERQVTLQARIKKLDNDLKEIQLLRNSKVITEEISLGTKIRLKDQKNNENFLYIILDQWDADVDKGIIAYKSPLGRALLGHKVGEVVPFGSGANESNFEVLGISTAVNEEGNLV